MHVYLLAEITDTSSIIAICSGIVAIFALLRKELGEWLTTLRANKEQRDAKQLENNAKQLELHAKESEQEKKDFDFIVERYQRMIAQFQDQMAEVLKRMDAAQKEHQVLVAGIEADHSACRENNARCDEKLKAVQLRLDQAELKLLQLSAKGAV